MSQEQQISPSLQQLPSLALPSIPSTFAMNKIAIELLTSGLSVGLANTITNPLDVNKVRLQLERRAAATGQAAPGLLRTGLNVVRNEGVLALWSGIGPSIARGFFFGGARLGLYTPIKAAISGGDGKASSFELKVLSGSLSGGLAAAVTSPIELIKTRLQAAGSAAGRAAAAPSTSMGVIRAVVSADGVTGLWKGAMPGLFRSAILTACQCATYDEVKRVVMQQTGMGNSIGTHLASSMIAGLVTTTITAPLDVVKTRMFLSGSKYTGSGAIARCAADVMRTEGLGGFMRGWSAAYARLGPHTVIMFLAAERLRKYAGLQGL